MREIRFRALAPDKKGNLKWFDDVITDGQEVWIQTKHQGIKHLKEIKALVQYTGLKDKNGVEIYEGDILGHGDTYFQVVFRDGAYLLFYKVEPSHRTLISLCEGLEVVGNIYEHSHLLESEK